MAHAVLHLGIPQPVTRHCNELLRPQVDNIRDFAGSHDNTTGKCQPVILQKLVLLQDSLEEHPRVVPDDIWLLFLVECLLLSRELVLDLICAK